MADFAMTFEETVKKIWGKPKTSVYFAGYYDLRSKDGAPDKAILFGLCLYEKNYNPDDYSDVGKEIIDDYITAFVDNNVTNEIFEKTVKYLHQN